MLSNWIHGRVALGLAQAAVSASVALAVILAAQRHGIHLMGEAAVALARGIVQIVAVGLVLAALMRGPQWTAPILLAAMVLAAAQTSVARLKGMPGAFRVSLWSMLLGSGSVIALMVLAGVIETPVSTLIPVGSMIIANAMNSNALALERFRSDVAAHTGEIESALALGAAPEATVGPYAQNSLAAGLIPSVNNLRSLGIVWIPGLMAGMVLTGARPLEASIYQFVVLTAILAASGLTTLISTRLMTRRAFSAADQLTLRK